MPLGGENEPRPREVPKKKEDSSSLSKKEETASAGLPNLLYKSEGKSVEEKKGGGSKAAETCRGKAGRE